MYGEWQFLNKLPPGTGEFLNDVIVNFFLMYLHKKELDSHDPTLKDNVHIFSTFFYKKLTSGGRKDSDLSQVRYSFEC